MFSRAIRTFLPSVLVTLSGVALAQAPSISWRAPANCGTSEELSAAVVKLMRQDTRTPSSMSFVGSIEPTPDHHWQLTLQGVTNGGGWSRQLVGATCPELRDAAIALIALAIDPNATEPALAAETQSSSAAINPHVPPEADASAATRKSTGAEVDVVSNSTTPRWVAPESRRDSKRPPPSTPTSDHHLERPDSRLLVMARTGFFSGLLPESTPVLFLGAAFTWARFRVIGELGWLRPQTRYSDGSAERGARIAAWAASVHGGYVQQFSHTALALSAGLLGGYLSGQSVGISLDSSVQGAAWVAASARLTAELPIAGDWSVHATTDAWYMLGAPRFKLHASDARAIFEPTKVGGMLALGVALRLW